MMTKERLNKARRLLQVQTDLKRLEEARIAGLQSRKLEIETLQSELVGALNADEGPPALLIAAVVARLKKLGEETALIAQELEWRTQALREHTGRTKHAERRVRGYEQQHEKGQAQKELLDIIERAIRPDDASLP